MRGSHLPLTTKTVSLILSGKKRAMIFRQPKYPIGYVFMLNDAFSDRKFYYIFYEIRIAEREELPNYYEDLVIDPESQDWIDYMKSTDTFYIYFFKEIKRSEKGKVIRTEEYIEPIKQAEPTDF
jgi:hypothetical protein